MPGAPWIARAATLAAAILLLGAAPHIAAQPQDSSQGDFGRLEIVRRGPAEGSEDVLDVLLHLNLSAAPRVDRVLIELQPEADALHPRINTLTNSTGAAPHRITDDDPAPHRALLMASELQPQTDLVLEVIVRVARPGVFGLGILAMGFDVDYKEVATQNGSPALLYAETIVARSVSSMGGLQSPLAVPGGSDILPWLGAIALAAGTGAWVQKRATRARAAHRREAIPAAVPVGATTPSEPTPQPPPIAPVPKPRPRRRKPGAKTPPKRPTRGASKKGAPQRRGPNAKTKKKPAPQRRGPDARGK